MKEMVRLGKVLDDINAKQVELKQITPRILKPWRYYLREHGNQIEALAQKMREEGFRQEFPLIVDLSCNEVVVGVVRFLAAQKAGIEQVPCVCYEKLELIEKYVMSCDDALKRAKKSPMAIVWQLMILHHQFGFSYREIEHLLGICRAEIGRKLQVPKTSFGIQRLYAESLISDSDVERIVKEVMPKHQDCLAEKLRQIGKKVSKKHLDKLLIGYSHALEELRNQAVDGKIPDKINIPNVDEAELEQMQLKREFPSALHTIKKVLRHPDLSWNNDIGHDLGDLEKLQEIIREAIRHRCAALGIEHRALSREEESQVLLSRMVKTDISTAPSPARPAKMPSKVIQFETQSAETSMPHAPRPLPAEHDDTLEDFEESDFSGDESKEGFTDAPPLEELSLSEPLAVETERNGSPMQCQGEAHGTTVEHPDEDEPVCYADLQSRNYEKISLVSEIT